MMWYSRDANKVDVVTVDISKSMIDCQEYQETRLT